MPKKPPAPRLGTALLLLLAACVETGREPAAPPAASFEENLARARSWAATDATDVTASYLQRAYAESRAAAPPAQDLAWVEITLGEIRRRQGRIDEAQVLVDSGVARLRAQAEPDPALLARGLDNLGMLLLTRGRDAEAVGALEEALSLRRDHLDANALDTARSEANLAEAVKRRGDYARAEQLLLEVEAVYAARGRRNVVERATLQNELGLLYQAMGRYDDAEKRHLEALGLAASAKREDNPNLAIFQRGLAGVYAHTGRRAEAEALYRRSLADLERLLGPDHEETRTSRKALESFLGHSP